MTREQRTELKREIVEYRKQGHVIRECAEHFGVKSSYIKAACHGVKYAWKYDTDAMSQAAKRQAQDRRPNGDTIVRLLAQRNNGFEYVGGYTKREGSADIRCRVCGHIFSRTYWSIKRGRVQCPCCQQRERRKKENADRIIKTRKAFERKAGRACQQAEMKVCPVCNSVFVGTGKYCTEKCRNHNHYSMKDGYRLLFPLIDVYDRDNGICYICGKACDWNDYIVEDGVIVYGNMYPSRDHVVPKSKGGANTWGNIRLAHRICNSLKGATLA